MEQEPSNIERLGEALWRIPLRALTLPPATRINAFALAGPEGAWVVDPGSSRRGELRRLETFLAEGPAQGRVAGYVITHHHPDHWAGLSALLRRHPGPVVAHSPGRLAVEARFLPPSALAECLAGAEAVHTPGHASDHLVIRLANGDIVAGDLVAGVGTVVIDPPDGDMRAYLDSLRRLLAGPVARLLPAHGPTVEDGRAKLEEYLAHRQMREGQVIEALTALGPATPAQLVPRIYPELGLLLRRVAARSVLAHLLKLEADGRAVRQGRHWQLTGG